MTKTYSLDPSRDDILSLKMKSEDWPILEIFYAKILIGKIFK